jgi:hypothetical protein
MFPRGLETIFWVKILKFFDADADPGFGNLCDPGSGIQNEKNSDLGSGINISDPQRCQKGTIYTDGKKNLFLLKFFYLAGHADLFLF